MVKVLIICKQLETAKKIFNNIICRIENLQLTGIANSFLEAKSILINNEADIIITTSKNTISFIKNNFINYSPGIVIIDSINRVEASYHKLLILNNVISLNEMKDNVFIFLKNIIEKSQKEKIANILVQLGFSFKWSGTIYLLDSILYAHSYKGSYNFEQVKRDIYTHVAIINNTTSDRVKWSIERAIKFMFAKHRENPQRPVSKQLISTIANSLDII